MRSSRIKVLSPVVLIAVVGGMGRSSLATVYLVNSGRWVQASDSLGAFDEKVALAGGLFQASATVLHGEYAAVADQDSLIAGDEFKIIGSSWVQCPFFQFESYSHSSSSDLVVEFEVTCLTRMRLTGTLEAYGDFGGLAYPQGEVEVSLNDVDGLLLVSFVQPIEFSGDEILNVDETLDLPPGRYLLEIGAWASESYGDGGLGGGGGTSFSLVASFTTLPVRNVTRNTCHASIQAAIDAALHGDEIVLSPGTYTGAGNRDIDFRGKAITVRSVDPEDPAVVAETVIDCQGSAAEPHRGFKFTSGEGLGSVLAGVTIINGYGPLEGIHSAGGAILCVMSTPVIRDCVFHGNQSGYWAGAIGLFDSPLSGGTAVITRCNFSNNVAGDVGAGVYMRAITALISNCRFLGNTAAAGAGVFSLAYGTGGASVIRNCIFDANYASIRGAAIRNSTDSTLLISNCTLTNNTALSEGGGLHTNSIFSPVVRNCIFWANQDAGGFDQSAQMHIGSGAVQVDYCLVQGWTGSLGGTGNSGANPMLMDLDGPDNNRATWFDNDLHLQPLSLCINAGDPNGDYTGQTDIDGEPRVRQSRVDIGADESPYPFEFTIGGVVYTNPDAPSSSGLPGVTIVVIRAGDGSVVGAAVTQGGQGMWQLDGVPEGNYQVIPILMGSCFSHVVGGEPDGYRSVCIHVNVANETANQNIAFLAVGKAQSDFDQDCDVDGTDLILFTACLSGPVVPLSPGCQSRDLDSDGDVDQDDFGFFQRSLSPAGMAGEPGCQD